MAIPLDANGRPIMTGLIGDMNPLMADYKGIEALGSRGVLNASTASASPWASMGIGQQGADQAASMAGSQGLQNSSLSQAQQGMAMRGGLDGGAADRMGRAAMESGALNAQNIRAQGMSDSLGAQMAGADLTTGADKFNAGQSQSTQAFNTQNRLNSLQGLNASNIANYGEKIKGFSAGQSANALAAAAGGKK